jgi:hypothetical protein
MEAINSLSKSYGVKITYASSNGMIEPDLTFWVPPKEKAII